MAELDSGKFGSYIHPALVKHHHCPLKQQGNANTLEDTSWMLLSYSPESRFPNTSQDTAKNCKL